MRNFTKSKFSTFFPVLLTTLLIIPLPPAISAAQTLVNPDTCHERVFEVERTQVHVLYYPRMETCVVQVVSRDRANTWRSYTFFGNGLFMVFNNFGSGPASTHTGARAYFTFPRSRIPSVQAVGGHLQVTTASGEIVTFDPQKTQITSFGTSEFKEDPKIHPANHGGFDILKSSVLALDLGFKLGELAHTSPKGKSKFIDSKGDTCELENQNLFTYVYEKDSNGKLFLDEVLLKFKVDSELSTFLSKTCPALDVKGLKANQLPRSPAIF